MTVVANCRFSCDPDSPDRSCPDAPHDGSGQAQTRPARLVELPVGATEDRVLRMCDAIVHRGPDDWGTFYTRSMLGFSLLGQKKFVEAEPLLVSGYEGMKQREDKI